MRPLVIPATQRDAAQAGQSEAALDEVGAKGSKLVLCTSSYVSLAAVRLSSASPPSLAVCTWRPHQRPCAVRHRAWPKKTYQDLIVGYAQLGAESEWRVGQHRVGQGRRPKNWGWSSSSPDAQQKQENQIKAIRSLIAQKVDVIGRSADRGDGLGRGLQEAKEAGIPIILVDRRADVPEDLYVTLPGLGLSGRGPQRRPHHGQP